MVTCGIEMWRHRETFCYGESHGGKNNMHPGTFRDHKRTDERKTAILRPKVCYLHREPLQDMWTHFECQALPLLSTTASLMQEPNYEKKCLSNSVCVLLPG